MFSKFIRRRGVAAGQRRWPLIVIFCCLPVAYPNLLWAAAPGKGTEDPQVTMLLIMAEEAIAANRLTTPAEDNAVAYIEQALALEPENQHAVDLLNRVTARYAMLVDSVLERGERGRLKSLERATTFRDRANRVISRYHIPETALKRMDRAIAAKTQDLPDREKPQVITADSTGQILNELMDRHVTLAKTFLDRRNLGEARWHTAQAETLAVRYKLADRGLQGLKQRLALEETGTKEYVETRKPVDEDTRQRLTELAAFYIVSGKVALSEGNESRASRHKHAAEDIISQYGLPNELVQHLSTQLALKPGLRRAGYRVYGTF